MQQIDISQQLPGLEIVKDLPSRGRGIFAMKQFSTSEVICDYGGKLLTYQDGKAKYEQTEENAMFMFEFKQYFGIKYWRDATEERLGPGRLINHSKCHVNVNILILKIICNSN